CCRRQVLIEIAREECEVGEVDVSVVVVVALYPVLVRAVEVCRKIREVDEIDSAVEIAVAVERVAKQDRGVVDREALKVPRKRRRDLRRFRVADRALRRGGGGGAANSIS